MNMRKGKWLAPDTVTYSELANFSAAQLGTSWGRGEGWGQYEQQKVWDTTASARNSTKEEFWVSWLPFALQRQLPHFSFI